MTTNAPSKAKKSSITTVKAGDIPRSWAVDLPDDPEAPVTVLITPAGKPSDRRLVDARVRTRGRGGRLRRAAHGGGPLGRAAGRPGHPGRGRAPARGPG